VPELALCPAPPRPDLVHQLRARVGELWPALRVIAEDVLGAETTIDWVALEPGGRAVVVLVGEAGEDLELVARGLAQRAWLLARLRDWAQLAPRIGLRPEAGVRALLLSPAFRPEAVAAVASLGPETLSLATYRCVRDRSGSSVLLETVPTAALPGEQSAAETPAVQPQPFRTGLTDVDLALTPEERREFELLSSPRGRSG
jgi:hypothetical protein